MLFWYAIYIKILILHIPYVNPAFQTHSTSDLPATFEVLDGHMWLVTSTLGGSFLQYLDVHLCFFPIALKSKGYIYLSPLHP